MVFIASSKQVKSIVLLDIKDMFIDCFRIRLFTLCQLSGYCVLIIVIIWKQVKGALGAYTRLVPK